MKKVIISLTVFLSAISFFACQENYVNDELKADKLIPVIEGQVKNDSGPYQVLLYYALPYNGKSRTSISGATVYVKDDIGNAFYYQEKSAGAYFSNPKTFCSTIGRSYTLFVEMPDGKILKSDPELLRDTLRIQQIIKKNETREEYYRNQDNQIITTMVHGESNYAIIDPVYAEKAFYRLISYYMIYGEGRYDTIYYKWVAVNKIPYEFMIDSTVYSKCVDVNVENTLPRIGIYNPDDQSGNIAFSFFVRSTDYYISDESFTVGTKSLFTYLYTISPEAYNYYESMNDQLNASSRIYDPLPTQLVGNMHCLSDSNQVVLGFFEASSYTLNLTNAFPHKIACYDSVVVSISLVEY
jgi:hypothetical protein